MGGKMTAILFHVTQSLCPARREILAVNSERVFKTPRPIQGLFVCSWFLRLPYGAHKIIFTTYVITSKRRVQVWGRCLVRNQIITTLIDISRTFTAGGGMFLHVCFGQWPSISSIDHNVCDPKTSWRHLLKPDALFKKNRCLPSVRSRVKFRALSSFCWCNILFGSFWAGF